MTKTMVGVGTLALLLGVGSGQAWAQYVPPTTSPFVRPAYSPYLNLLRPGNSPATNYLGLVRPQQQFSSGIQQLGQQNSALQQNFSAFEATANLPITGQRSQFMNYRRYFLNAFGGQQTGYRSPFASGLNANQSLSTAGTGTGGLGARTGAGGGAGAGRTR